MEETRANVEHATMLLRKQIFAALHVATDHKSAVEEMLCSALAQTEELHQTVLAQESAEVDES